MKTANIPVYGNIATYRNIALSGGHNNSLVFVRPIRLFGKLEFLFHEDSQYTRVWKYCDV